MHSNIAAAIVEAGRAAVGVDRQRLAGEREHGGGAERHDEAGADEVELALQPPAVMRDLARGGALVQPALAALDVLEVLDGVGDVGFLAVDAGLGERAVEELAGGADEGAAGEVLLVARLLADEGDGGAERALAEDGAGAALDHGRGGGDQAVELGEALRLLGRHGGGHGRSPSLRAW